MSGDGVDDIKLGTLMTASAPANNTKQATIEIYNQQAHFYGTRFLSLDTSELCQRFLSLLPEKAHILDVGCGPGRDTQYFLDRGYQVTAMDASEELVKMGRAYTGHPILHMTFEEMAFREAFDGIWAMASLLHLSRPELLQVLEKNLIPALKPQGIFFLCFLHGEGERLSNGRYFMDYTRDGLSSLLTQFRKFIILDIWLQEDNSPDRQGRQWVHGLVQKKCL